ncbi:MAG: AAA family ATPase, partial [Patescibacteria group bacterium]
MKLVAFRVKNFRSIIDSGWCDLSTDDITTIIGQNESGKSALLDALSIFYKPTLDDDSIRSDDTLPEISCTFKLTRKDVTDLFDENEIPKGFRGNLESNGSKITLTRTWNGSESDSNSLELENEKLKQLLIDQAEEVRLEAEARAKAKPAPQPEPTTPEEPTVVPATTTAETAPETPATTEAAVPESVSEPVQTIEEEEEPAERLVLGYQGFIKALFIEMPEFVTFTDLSS